MADVGELQQLREYCELNDCSHTVAYAALFPDRSVKEKRAAVARLGRHDGALGTRGAQEVLAEELGEITELFAFIRAEKIMKGGGAGDAIKITQKVRQILEARYDQHGNTAAELNILYRAKPMSKAWCQSKTAAAWNAAHAAGTAAPTDLAPAAGAGSRCVHAHLVAYTSRDDALQ